jgi:hypothetical protein
MKTVLVLIMKTQLWCLICHTVQEKHLPYLRGTGKYAVSKRVNFRWKIQFPIQAFLCVHEGYVFGLITHMVMDSDRCVYPYDELYIIFFSLHSFYISKYVADVIFFPFGSIFAQKIKKRKGNFMRYCCWSCEVQIRACYSI